MTRRNKENRALLNWKKRSNQLMKGKEMYSHLALPTKNIKVINSFYKGMHDMQRCLRL